MNTTRSTQLIGSFDRSSTAPWKRALLATLLTACGAAALASFAPGVALAQSDESNIKEDATEGGASGADAIQDALDQRQEDIRKLDEAKKAEADKDEAKKKTPDKPVVNPKGPIPKEMWQGSKVDSDKEGKEGAEDRKDLVVGDPEFGPLDGAGRPTKELPLKLEFSLRSEAHTFDNLDLQSLVERTDQDIINTDDRSTFAYSSIFGRANYKPSSDLEINVAFGHNGLWSEDQLGSEAQALGVFLFGELSFTYTPVKTEGFELSTTIGRQPFRIGGVPRDYVLDDLLDAVVLKLDFGKAGRLRVLVADFYAANDLPSASFVRYVGGREATLGLRGDTWTYRNGLVYENDSAIDGLEAKVYGFYADIGGGPIVETGADLSEGGTLGNFSDNDWAAVFGGRVAYDLKFDQGGVRFFGEVAHSEGIDRKLVVARDVTISGNAFGGGAELRYETGKTFGFAASGDLYRFDGSKYGDDGLEYERGFVGFKGRQVGGLALDRYAGFHPSAFVGSGGVESQPNHIERIAGTQTLRAGAAFTLYQRATLSVDWWLLSDTRETEVDLDNLDAIDPPFSYSREEYASQERAGTTIGQELDVALSYRFNRLLTGYTTFGAFLPDAYYKIKVDRVVGTALGGDQTFWAATAGAVVEF